MKVCRQMLDAPTPTALQPDRPARGTCSAAQRRAHPPNAAAPPPAQYRLLAVAACPMGVAHTYLAAEALRKAARAGVTIKVETNGAVGVNDELESDESPPRLHHHCRRQGRCRWRGS